MTKKYARIIYPGTFFADESVKEVTDTNPANFQLPDRAIGVKFFERAATQVDGEELLGQEKNQTGWFYRGTLVTKDTPGIGEILKSNLVNNGYTGAVQYGGVTYPLNKNDVIYWTV
jgi:hypothetical protein